MVIVGRFPLKHSIFSIFSTPHWKKKPSPSKNNPCFPIEFPVFSTAWGTDGSWRCQILLSCQDFVLFQILPGNGKGYR